MIRAVRIIITGGTFDKQYDPLQGKMTFKDSHLPDIIKQARITVPVNIEINQLIDSLDMKDENRNTIIESCRKAPEDNILITHGTDRMVETAQALGRLALQKTIVLTGAMVPYSEVWFNTPRLAAAQRARSLQVMVLNQTVL